MIAPLILAVLGPQLAQSEESHPGLAAESLYAEAVIAFNKKDYVQAHKDIQKLLKANPNHIEGLQLQALAFKAQGQPNSAYESYRRLLQLTPEKSRGPYYFELGVILNSLKKSNYAKPLFRRAIALRFNTVPSHLFLGLMEYADNRVAAAQNSFEYVAADRDPEMAAIGHYYLGIIYLKNGVGGLGLGELLEAQAAALRAPPESKTTKDLAEAARKIVMPFDKGQWFASATLIPGYDSNVAITPMIGTGATGTGALQVNYSAGGGYMSSPMRLIQAVASVRSAGNFNFFPITTMPYNFYNFTGSLFLTYKPMGRVSLGVKGDVTFTLKQILGEDGASYPFSPFALLGDPGFYLRYQPNSHLQVQWDIGARPGYYFNPNSDFSGTGFYTRVTTRWLTGMAAFNPGFTLGGDITLASGDPWKYVSANAELSNLIRIGARNTLILAGVFTGYTYYLITRKDANIVARVSDVFTLTKNWSILADASFTLNRSTDYTTFSYDRWAVRLGAGWAL